MKTSHKLTKNGNEFILEITTEAGKQAAICPFSTPLLIPDKFGIQVAPRYCGSSCPMFKIKEGSIELACKNISYDIEQEKSNFLKL